MSRSTVERLASHGAVSALLAVLVYLFVAATSAVTPGNIPVPTATPKALAAQPTVEAPIATPSPAIPVQPAAAPTPSPRTLRVGIQVGHWRTDEVPDELSKLSTVEGVKWDGLDETVICQQVAELLARTLADAGVQYDILPTTVPEGYSADLFLSLHADAYKDDGMKGFKVARSAWSDNPERDDRLVAELEKYYGEATGLPEHRDTITDAMTEYYAFNYSEFRHSISPTTPGVILELGFLSSEEDRRILVEEQHMAVQGIANAILDFLSRLP